MGRRGSEQRQKTRSVLVRVSEADYERLSHIVSRDGGTMADYLRRRIEEPLLNQGIDKRDILSASDRQILAQCSRSMGHLAGLLKLAVNALPSTTRAEQVMQFVAAQRGELQNRQEQLRAFIEDHSE
jgi:hypothetical protein